MPWSEWIQSDPYERGTTARYKMQTQTTSSVDAAGSIEEVFDTAEPALYSTTEATCTVYGQNASVDPGASRDESANDLGHPGVWIGGIVQVQAVAWFDTGDLELATWREWFPNELYDLTEGVDYEVRPDRTGTEDDAFIQYEDGVGQIQNWYAFASGRVTNLSASYDPRHATVKWRLLSPPPAVPAIPPINGSIDAPPVAFTPDDGAPVAQIINTTVTSGPGSSTPVEVIIDGPVSEFAVLMVTDKSSDIPFDANLPGEGNYSHDWNAAGLPSAAAAYVRLPRWRYWKPGDSWVKLKNRGDGLGMSTKRLRGRGTSNQAGRLRGSY